MRFPKAFRRTKGQIVFTGDHAQAKANLALTLGANQTGNFVELNTTGQSGGSLLSVTSGGQVRINNINSYNVFNPNGGLAVVDILNGYGTVQSAGSIDATIVNSSGTPIGWSPLYLNYYSNQAVYWGNNLSDCSLNASGSITTNGLFATYSDNAFGGGVTIKNTNTGNQALSGFAVQNSSGTTVGQINYVSSVYANSALQNTFLFNTVGNVKMAFNADSTNTYHPDIYFRSGARTDAIHIVGSNNHVLINTATDNGTDAMQVNGSLNVLTGGSTINGQLYVNNSGIAVQGQFGNTLPFYLISNQPNLGFNSYYNSGWKFGAGSSSSYGGAMSFNCSNGDISWNVSNAGGSANGSITFSAASWTTKQNGHFLIGTTTDNGTDLLQVAGTITATSTITGSLFSGSGASLTSLNASNLSSGTVATARLGSGTASSTTYLRGDGTWATPAGGGGGATSVGLSMPSIFTVTNSPVTTTGTLTATLNSQSANLLLASPDGTSGTPTFRSLVVGDFPTSGATAGTYTNSTVTVDNKGRVTSASSSARTTVTHTTISLANGVTDTTTTTVALGKTFTITKVTTSGSAGTGYARVRVYATDADRSADLSRGLGVTPTPGTGLLLEFVTNSTYPSIDLGPMVVGSNLDSSPNSYAYIAVTNTSGTTAVITTTFTILKLES